MTSDWETRLEQLANERYEMEDLGNAHAIRAALAENARLREALASIANHGLDLPAAACATDDYQNGYSRGVVSQAAIARSALRDNR